MSSRITTMCGAIGLAAALSLGAAAPGGAQGVTDTSTTRTDTSMQRIPVHKETGTTLDTTSSGGAIAPTDTTAPVSSDTTGAGGVTGDTSTAPMDTSRMRDTTADTTGGVTGTGAATDTATNRSNMSADTTTNPVRTDTTTAPPGGVTTDTTAAPPGGVTTDTTTNPTGVTTDTSAGQTGISRDTTTTQVPTDTSTMGRDTTTGVSAAPTTDTTYTGPSTRRGRLFKNNFYIGVGGGASLPIGDFKDGYKTGWNVSIPIGWQSPTTPWGLRLDGSYDRMNGKSLSSGGSSFQLSDAAIWSGMLDLTFRLPMGTENRASLYLMGGGGVHHFTDYGGSSFTSGGTTYTTNSSSSTTKMGVNGGAGIEFPLGAANMFVEGRFVSVFTKGNNTNYIPVILGFKFF